MGSTETVESLVQKLSASSDADELTELVITLKTVLGHYSRAELAEKIVSNENLVEILFGCLSPNPEHEQLVQNSCDILKQLMAIADPADILSRYHKDMLEGLEEHPLPDVRLLVLAQLDKCLTSDHVIKSLCNDHSDLVLSVIRQHSFPELSVANRASKLIIKLASNHIGEEFLGSDESLGQFLDLVTATCTVSVERYRIYDTLAHLATVSPSLFEKIQSSVNLASTLSDVVFGNSDPLGGANALEILATLAGTPFGLETVKQIGVVEKIERLTQEMDSNPLSSLLFPEMLKFIGKVGVNQLPPQRLREIVLETVMRRDLELYVTTVAIEAMTLMGCTVDGKRYLFGKAETVECFKRARQILENSQTEYRIRIIECMTILFGTEDTTIGSGHQYCLPHWFNLLFPQISTLFDLVQQPFPDIRLSALHFLTVVAPIEWAQNHYLSTPGIVEFLTNREVEPNKECLIAKYKIVSIIADSKSASKILSVENYGRLKIYKDQGPFYAAATSAVATEGSG